MEEIEYLDQKNIAPRHIVTKHSTKLTLMKSAVFISLVCSLIILGCDPPGEIELYEAHDDVTTKVYLLGTFHFAQNRFHL